MGASGRLGAADNGGAPQRAAATASTQHACRLSTQWQKLRGGSREFPCGAAATEVWRRRSQISRALAGACSAAAQSAG